MKIKKFLGKDGKFDWKKVNVFMNEFRRIYGIERSWDLRTDQEIIRVYYDDGVRLSEKQKNIIKEKLGINV